MLPRLINGISLSPFLNDGELPPRYLVAAGARNFVVNFRTRVLIEALQLDGEFADVAAYIHEWTNKVISEEELQASIARLPPALFDHALAHEHQTPISCRLPVVPAPVVEWLGIRAAGIFSLPGFTVCAVVLGVAMPFAWLAAQFSLRQTDLTWRMLGSLSLGFVASALLHELGHASAVARAGLKPGHIGFGLYWFWPVFYTDVNAAWKLPPRQRAMVDLGGIYFQLLWIAGLVPFAFAGPATEAVRLLILFNLYSVLQNLNPVFKLDGYWMLADLARIPNLHRRARSFWRGIFTRGQVARENRSVFLLYGFAVCTYVGYVLALLPAAIRLQAIPRLGRAAAHLELGVESWRHFEWSGAFGQLALAVQAAAMPAVAALSLVLWLAGLCRRPGGTASKITGVMDR